MISAAAVLVSLASFFLRLHDLGRKLYQKCEFYGSERVKVALAFLLVSVCCGAAHAKPVVDVGDTAFLFWVSLMAALCFAIIITMEVCKVPT